MATLREDKARHVIGGELHRFADRCAHVLRSPDRQDGEGQPSGPALLVLRDGRIECAVEADARTLDELATFVVAVNQSLAVLSRAGTSDAELRSVTRLACTTVADTLARAASEEVTQS
ncbi:hypothetical protein O3Q52_04675 [Streptomyces sp. ActVer]|uniref:hypothetical protein n=1 Tax=Streptomyces sp. ActVer TaxID=3014558 RepID=UPI0022B5D7C8|nr:hypothetical protein [Streptomyces sp. ActVer]MCZ4507515.1 hypothetical protein [Streptomyces sp. ActVer]